MNTVKKLQKIQEALNHMSKAVSLVEAAKNIDIEKPTPVHDEVSSLKFGGLNLLREKMGYGVLEGINVDEMERNLEDAQIEAKAEELYNIYHEGDNTKLEWGGRDLDGDEFPFHERFRAIARHLATPQNDVQHALQAALESERELMDILRKIGKVFGKNVGIDIGILDLPKLVEGNFEQLRELRNQLVIVTGNVYTDKSFTDGDLINEVTEMYRRNLNHAKHLDENSEAHKQNSKQILRLNTWLIEKQGVNVALQCTDDALLTLFNKTHAELEAHRENSKQIVRLNSWLQEHNLGEPGVCVTDTIIELLEKAVSPERVQTLSPRLVSDLQLLLGVRVKTNMDGTSDEGFNLVDKLMDEYVELCKKVSTLGLSIPHELR